MGNQCRWSPATYAIHEEDLSKEIKLDEAINYYIPEHRPIIERCVKEGIEQKKPWDEELQIRTAAGNVRWVRAIGEPVFIADTLIRLQGVFEEIDERKRLEIELERSNQELAQFAYRTSHDLKSPLIAIRRTTAYMLQDMDDGNLEEVKRNAEKIGHRAKTMETMVLGILNAAKAELTDPLPEPIDLHKMIGEIIEASQTLRDDNGVTVRSIIDCETQPSLPYIRIYQILYNLTTNGIKYADSQRAERFVEIRATSRPDLLELSVEDNGRGIPNSDDTQPYEMFRRFHSDVSGSGLGLYIVKKHIESLGGQIQLATAETGTRFEMKIPLRRT